MYPAQFFGLFPPFPRDQKAFMAMSFAPTFTPRWTNVLQPAVSKITVNGSSLVAHRVDMRVASDSVLTEILDGISRCRIFIADISMIAEVDGSPIRNANVLYEVGLAHAVRQPQEVLLFRSDNRPLLFDTANIRVNEYDPDGAPDAAREQVADAIVAGLEEVELQKHLAIRRAYESLDLPSWWVLMQALHPDGIRHPLRQTMAEALAAIERADAIARLVDLGALTFNVKKATVDSIMEKSDKLIHEVYVYRLTEFGEALAKYMATELGLDSPELQRALEARFQEESKS